MRPSCAAIAGVCATIVVGASIGCRSSDPLFEAVDAAGAIGGSGGKGGSGGNGALSADSGAGGNGASTADSGAGGNGGLTGTAGAGGAAAGGISGTGGSEDAAGTDGPVDAMSPHDTGTPSSTCGSLSCRQDEVCVVTAIAGGVPGSGVQTTYACEPRPDGCSAQPDCACASSLCPMISACVCRTPAAESPTIRCECAAP